MEAASEGGDGGEQGVVERVGVHHNCNCNCSCCSLSAVTAAVTDCTDWPPTRLTGSIRKPGLVAVSLQLY